MVRESVLCVKLVIEYDGTSYAGWQRQKDAPTIQAAVEDALERILGRRVPVHGSGRTDAGVHALGQVAHFTTDASYDVAVYQAALNALLPRDIVIKEAALVPSGFHARYSATYKLYRYLIWNVPHRPALLRSRVWHVRHLLDVGVMQRCLALLSGSHDFSAFASADGSAGSRVRTVMHQEITARADGTIVIGMGADGFLRHMVRNVVGTLALVGMHKMSIPRFGQVLASGDRSQAGPKAPPQGLYLVEVRYDGSPA